MAERSPPNPMPSEYDELPEAVQYGITPKEFAWLSDAEKARLIQTETEPEWEE